jgi:plastocyanin
MRYRIALVLALGASIVATVFVANAAVAARTAAVQKETVLMFDFRFKLSKPTLHPGKATFTVMNRGHSIHNFDLQGVHQSPFLAPGQTKSFTVTLKAGKFYYLCTVPRHESLGMFGNLIVK